MSEHHNLENLLPEEVSLSLSTQFIMADLIPSGILGLTEYESLYEDDFKITSLSNPNSLYPNGVGTIMWGVKVTDQNSTPISGVEVFFSVTPSIPNGSAWRSLNEFVARFGSTKDKVRERIQNGKIRLIGTVSNSSVKTNSNGDAIVTYRVSHIGSNDVEMAKETITAKIPKGSSFSSIDQKISIGYDWLKPIPQIPGGLRIIGATGKYFHEDLVERFQKLGESIVKAKWKFPITITAGTLQWGGIYPPHFSHQWGAEIDIRPMTSNGEPGRWDSTNYDREKTQILVNALLKLGAEIIYFNDKQLLGVTYLQSHDDHLHVSFALPSTNKIKTIREGVSLADFKV